MAAYAAACRAGRTPGEVFDVIGTHCCKNHPRVKIEPGGVLRLMSPVIALQLPKRTARITRSTADTIEFEPQTSSSLAAKRWPHD